MTGATLPGAARGRRFATWLLRTLAAILVAPTLAALAGSVLLVPVAGPEGLAVWPYALLGCVVLTVLWGLPCHLVLSLTGLRTLPAYLTAGAVPPTLFAVAAALDSTSLDAGALLLLSWLLFLSAGCAGIGWYVAIGPDSLD